MKWNLVLVLCLSAGAIQAQQTNEVEALKRQLQQATEKFDRSLQEHRKIIDDLNRRLEQVQAAQTTSPPAVVAETPLPEPSDQRTRGIIEPMRLGTRRAYMDIGLVGT